MSFRAKVWTALWAVYILWGSTYLAIAIAVETLPPLLAVSTRFIAAGAIMAAIVLWRGGSLRVGRRELGWCVVIGCLLPGANAVLFYAERDIPIGVASLIIASVPLLVVVLRLASGERVRGAGARRRRRRLHRRRGAAAAVGRRDRGQRRALPALGRHVVRRLVRCRPRDDARRTRSPRPRTRCSPAGS